MNGQALIAMFRAASRAIDENRQHLCDLDGVIGDADHGVTMGIGFAAIDKALGALDASASPSEVFNTAARSFLSAVGASAGPLYATAFMRAGAAIKGIDDLDAGNMSTVIEAMAEGISTRGKAEVGDKTMLDAWSPAAVAARDAHDTGADVAGVLHAASEAADAGATATIELQAKKGRSARLGERSIGHKDAGAASTAILLRAFAGTELQ